MKYSDMLWPAAKFMAVGVIITGIDFVFFKLICVAGMDVDWARTVGFVAAFSCSYVLNRVWTFNSQKPWLSTFIPYLGTRLICFMVAQGVFLFLHHGMGVAPDAAFWLVAPLQPLGNFLAGHFYVFRQTSPDPTV
jgi:putative flippase GtrA